MPGSQPFTGVLLSEDRLLDDTMGGRSGLASIGKYWGFWATTFLGIAIFIVWLIAQIIAIVAVVLPQLKPSNFSDDGSTSAFVNAFVLKAVQGDPAFWSIVAGAVAGCGAIALFIKLKRGATVSDYVCIRPVPWRTLAMWIGALLAFRGVAWVLVEAFAIDFGSNMMVHFFDTAKSPWVVWLALVFAAPVFEETFFRGFLLRGFEMSRVGVRGAVILTSALWAAIHLQYNFYGMAFIACMGVLLGIARVSSHSIVLPMILHALSNSLSLAFIATKG